MTKTLLTIAFIATLVFSAKQNAIMFFSKLDLPLDQFKPISQAALRFNVDESFYFYIYSKEKFNTDNLRIVFINLDNKGILFPKPEIMQTLNIDVDPEATAVKGQINLLKDGQYLVDVYNLNQPDKPLLRAEVWME